MENSRVTNKPGIGQCAPSFHAISTQGEINFPGDYQGRWVVLFSYQADFTPICTTELMMFAYEVDDFKKLNVQLIGISCDSIYTHIAWLRKVKELVWKDMKHMEVDIPLITDSSMEITGQYGMLFQDSIGVHTDRTVFVIDPEGKIKACLTYPTSVGRNIQEIKRLVIALIKTEADNAATPADWVPGEDVMLLPPITCLSAAERIEKVNENMYCLDWFIGFKQSNNNAATEVTEPEAIPYPSSYPVRRRTNYRR